MTPLERLAAWLEAQRAETLGQPRGVVRRAHFGGRNLAISGAAEDLRRLRPEGLWPATPGQPELRLALVPAAARAALPEWTGLRRGAYGCVVAADVAAGLRPPPELGSWVVCLDPARCALLAYDTARNVALLVPGVDVAPREQAEFCRPLLHWAAIGAGHVLVHAAAVARGERGLLVAGAGRAGKTTLVRACLAAGFEYLGDNVVELDVAGEAIWGVYPTLKVRPDGPAFDTPLPAVRDWDTAARKEIHFLGGRWGTGFRPRVATHAATLVLVEDGPPEIVPLTPARAFFATAPHTLAQFPFFQAAAFARLRRVSGRAATYTAGRLPLATLASRVGRLIA